MTSFSLPPGQKATRAGDLLTGAQIRFAVLYPAFAPTAREYHLFGDPGTDLTLDPPPPPRVNEWMLLQ